MKVFMTGGSGFVGINVIEYFLNKGVEVCNYDCTDIPEDIYSHLEQFAGAYRFVKGDVLDRKKIEDTLADCGADTVVHMAVITVTEDRERHDTKHIFDVNCGGTLNVLDASVSQNVKKFVYVSSIAAYGTAAFDGRILREDQEILKPENLYQVTKYTSERLVLRYRYLYGLNGICARLGDVFGPWERPTEFRDKMSAPCTTLHYAMDGSRALITRPNRTSWVYSREIAAELFHLCSRSSRYTIYNLSSKYIWSIEDWCRGLMAYFPEFNWSFTGESEEANVFYHGEKDNAPMCVERLCQEGYEPVFDLRRSMEDYISWADAFPEVFRGVE